MSKSPEDLHRRRTGAFRDLVGISAVSILVFVLVSVFGGFRTFQEWARRQPQWTEWHIYDYVFVFVILAFALAIFSLRRWKELRGQVTDHRWAEEALGQAEEKYRSIFENAVEGIFQTTVDGYYLTANPTLARIFGYQSPEELIASVSDLEHQFYVEPGRRAEFIRLMKERGRISGFESQAYCKDGSVIWISENARALRDSSGRLLGFEGTTVDLTERKRVEEELRQAYEKLTLSMKEMERRTGEITRLSELGELLQSCQSAEEAYKVVAEAGAQLFPSASGALCLVSASRNTVEAVTSWGRLQPTQQVFAPDDCWALRRGRVHLVENPNSPLQCGHLRKAGWACYLCVPLVAQGEALGVLHLQVNGKQPGEPPESSEQGTKCDQGVALAVAGHIALALANLRLRETLRSQSIRDPLTGLFNRRFMEESLERELRRATRSKRSVAVILLDLDRFKSFNDTFGHEAGDILLRELGGFLQGHIRAGDIACRYGGEEFTLMLPEAPLEVACNRAELLRREVKYLIVQHRGQALGAVTLSLGVAVFPEDGTTPEELLRAADQALYRAKGQGRDCVAVAHAPESEKTR